jgi:hypothetical protein
MEVRFISMGDEFLQPLFFTSQSLHPRVVFLIFPCVRRRVTDEIFLLLFPRFITFYRFLVFDVFDIIKNTDSFEMKLYEFSRSVGQLHLTTKIQEPD